MIGRSRKMSGARVLGPEQSQELIPTRVMIHEGLPYVMAHAGQATIGYFAPNGESETEASRIILTIWREPTDPRSPGLALAFTPEPAHAEDLAQTLLQLAAQVRQRAADAADAALRKAAGR